MQDRITLLKKIYPSIDEEVLKSGGLSLEMANMMIENWIGIISLPLGLGLNFDINGEKYSIPMAIEEPSVIAAASSAAKFISDKGSGFKMHATDPIMVAQIQIIGVNYDSLKYVIEEKKYDLIKEANTHWISMVKRGGGVKALRHRKLYEIDTDDEFKDVISIELLVDVQESMGMNVCNTIAEKTTPFIKKIVGKGKIGLRITTNLCLERMASAFFKIPIKNLAWKSMTGKDVADGILNAYQFAYNDKLRCWTHNKGIMNGIDAVAIALGQDWRAIESAAHTYASLNDGLKPLTHYKIVKNNDGEEYLLGKIELPLAWASKGGALATSKAYMLTHMIMRNPTGRQIAGILAWVGLAQNFAAIKALAVEGIQKGHMNLHAKNIAISAGVPPHLINEVVEFMIQKDRINVEAAKLYMNEHNIRESSIKLEGKEIKEKQLSTFYIEINHPILTESIKLNLVFDTPEGVEPINLHMMRDEEGSALQKELFLNHSYDWILKIVLLLDLLQTAPGMPEIDKSKFISLRYRLKLIMILIEHTISVIHSKYNGEGLDNIIKMWKGEAIQYSISKETFFIHNLLIELIAAFKNFANEHVQNSLIKKVNLC